MDNMLEKEAESKVQGDIMGDGGGGPSANKQAGSKGSSGKEQNYIDEGLGAVEKKEGLPDNQNTNNEIAQQMEKEI
ncbi:MAG: hypothetical protein M1827_002245 [Pycnora praestabilis]|nr:MAG: hypothetical protein M1827_002245 [Pycnora praestabilis]